MVTLVLQVFTYNVFLCFWRQGFVLLLFCFIVVDEKGGLFASLLKTFTQNLDFL